MVKLSKAHHELKIAYLQSRLKELPHGFFSTYRGNDVVILFYDPADPRVTHDRKARYSVRSKRGELYRKQVAEYVELKGQLDALLKEWKALYRTPPRKIRFPLRKKRKDPIDRAFFENAVPEQNMIENQHPIHYNGHTLRSKNELVLCQVIEKMGYEYKNEIRIDFDEFTFFCPDSSIFVPEVEKVILFEIDGAMDKSKYVSKSYHNTAICVQNGLVEGKDFVVARIGSSYDINAEQIENLIRGAIEASIDDIEIESAE